MCDKTPHTALNKKHLVRIKVKSQIQRLYGEHGMQSYNHTVGSSRAEVVSFSSPALLPSWSSVSEFRVGGVSVESSPQILAVTACWGKVKLIKKYIGILATQHLHCTN